MRTLNWLILTGAALATAGCVESMDSGYPTGSYGYGDNSNGYANGYYSASSYQNGYYARPSYVSNNTYVYNPPPRVVTQTRYVPVPVAAPAPPRPQPANATTDHRWSNQHNDRPAQSVRPPSNNDRQASSGDNRSNSRRREHDRDGDGQPDRRN